MGGFGSTESTYNTNSLCAHAQMAKHPSQRHLKKKKKPNPTHPHLKRKSKRRKRQGPVRKKKRCCFGFNQERVIFDSFPSVFLQ